MRVITTISEVRELTGQWRGSGETIGLVPTMGALHAGHLALVREGARHARRVVVTLFVNPTQFAPDEDLGRYPRDLGRDIDALTEQGYADVLFAPLPNEIYPNGPGRHFTQVSVRELASHLCGPHRPGHFDGVTTVVAKLFGICKPDIAVFGLKDAQQFVIIRRMVEDLDFDIRVIGVPTVREADGLALSSRNAYLTKEERSQAVNLSIAVRQAQELVENGEANPGVIVDGMRRAITQDAPLARIQYAELVDAHTLQPMEMVEPRGDLLAAVAVFFGTTRLIDNAFVTAPDVQSSGN